MFIKGQSGNPNGRPKGSEDKEKKELRIRIRELLDRNQERFDKIMNNLSDKEFINAHLQLLEYAVPKLNRTEMDLEIKDRSYKIGFDSDKTSTTAD